MKRIPWIVAAAFSLFWIFFPEPTDAIPVIGWLDEGAAFGLFLYSLRKLGVGDAILAKLGRITGRGGHEIRERENGRTKQ